MRSWVGVVPIGGAGSSGSARTVEAGADAIPARAGATEASTGPGGYDRVLYPDRNLTDGTIADGDMVQNDPAQDHIVISGRTVTDETLLYDLRSQGNIEEKELTIPRSQIQDMQSYGPWHNNYLALYFTLTGLHALHILGGSIVIGYLWGPGRKLWKKDPERFTNRIEVSGLFWHFVDLVWIFLFPVLYLT